MWKIHRQDKTAFTSQIYFMISPTSAGNSVVCIILSSETPRFYSGFEMLKTNVRSIHGFDFAVSPSGTEFDKI